MYRLRPYQQQAADVAVRYFKDRTTTANGIMVLPTGSGKSLVIADIAARLGAPVLVFQPSKEILEQNYAKLCAYDILECAVYSASCNSKAISRITFATIGSVKNHVEEFSHFRYVIVDECHMVNPKEGMYRDFFKAIRCKIIGLTATPYRLYSTRNGAVLRFITNTSPRVFSRLLFFVQIDYLFGQGYLAKLNYYRIPLIDLSRLRRNSTGADYTDDSVQREYRRVSFNDGVLSIVRRLLRVNRRGILLFSRFVEEARYISDSLPGMAAIVSQNTPKKERERILADFKAGRIKVVTNVGVLTTGFDYPELDTVVLARPTLSLALYYQMVGRAIRPHPSKAEGWIVDLCGNFNRFGRVEDLQLASYKPGTYCIQNRTRVLTNVYM